MMIRKKKASKVSDPANAEYVANLVRALDDGDGAQKTLNALLANRPIDADVLVDLARALRASEHSKRQQAAANLKHRDTRKAKDYVAHFWGKSRYRYKTNRAFSEDAAIKVAAKFGVIVKPETIARDWLKSFDFPKNLVLTPRVVAFADGVFFEPKVKRTLTKGG